MKSIRIHEHGAPEVIRVDDAPEPETGVDDVTVRVKATSVNHLDLFVRRGIPGIPTKFPRILGSDAAGVVERVGANVKSVSPGDRVVLDCNLWCGECESCLRGSQSCCVSYGVRGESCDGTNAELVSLHQRFIRKLADGTDFVTAASAALVGQTAWRMLIERAKLLACEDVLIIGAGAGVGTMCIQIARMLGARVFATSRDAKKLDKCAELGADFLIDTSKVTLHKEIKKLTGGRGVDVVVDYIGKATLGSSIRSVRSEGRIVTCGGTSGYDPVLELNHIFYRQISIIGSTMAGRNAFNDMMTAVERGKIAPVIDRVMKPEEMRDAHQLLEDSKITGKIAISWE
ncbi:MAG: zinc-binding dehydrogenase [Planctomycetes bacterium]|nr:zinc-binding dehydrogenase [Planctomycetota bacterium]